eukprot:scaffold5788_cov159-Ochromonas_danica.AAC.12
MGNETSSLEKLQATNCRIVVVGPKSGDDCLLELVNLPKDARILATGANLEELKKDEIINEMPFLTWIHSITAGVDHLLCPEIVNNEEIILTNAKGIYNHSLAEYAMLACSYFSKNVPRLMKNKEEKVWDKFVVSDLRHRTMGIVGYGSIGQTCAKLAKAYGMKVLALRKHPDLSANDRNVDQVFGRDQLEMIMRNSDYVVVSMALTPATRHYIDDVHLRMAKKGQVIINIGRGPLIDEDALIACLQDGTIAGAALDVFSVEPLPSDSPLWTLPNVLISPHNADYTGDGRHRSVRFFTQNCAKFLAGEDLDSIVDKTSGY